MDKQQLLAQSVTRAFWKLIRRQPRWQPRQPSMVASMPWRPFRSPPRRSPEVGDLFESGDLYLPSLMLAGEAMKRSMSILSRYLSVEQASQKKGKVVIGAVSGDIHDIGKNLVATMLSVHGYEVVDVGVNVPPMEIIDTAQREHARFIALSSLMTTSMPYQRDVLELLTRDGRSRPLLRRSSAAARSQPNTPAGSAPTAGG